LQYINLLLNMVSPVGLVVMMLGWRSYWLQASAHLFNLQSSMSQAEAHISVQVRTRQS
jgi:hypothetical protein